MLRRLTTLWTKKVAGRDSGRVINVSRHRHFEHLESRSMLAANPVSMAYGPGYEITMMDHGLAGPPRFESGMFAPPPEQVMAPGATHHPHGDFDAPIYSSNLGDGLGTSNQQYGEPNSGHSTSSLGVPSNYKPVDQPTPTTSVRYVIIFTSSLSYGDTNLTPPPPKTNGTVAKATAPPTIQDNLPPLVGSNGNYQKTPAGQTGSGQKEYVRAPGETVLPAVAVVKAAYTTAATTKSDDSSSRPTIPVTDVAFQGYMPQLLLVANASQSAATPGGNSEKTVPTDDADGDFIQLDGSLDANGTPAADAIAQERAAVDAVLERLQDVDSLPVDAFANHITDQQLIDAATALPFDSIAFADTEGGMVMIDVSEASVAVPANAAVLAENAIELPSLNTGVESAVGFYQAIDVGGDEFSTAESAPISRPSIEPLDTARPENRLSRDGGNRSQKTAAAIVASTLAGALLWASQRSRRDDEEEGLAAK